jgi:16S rRNA C967 or C1407 C5-methylase (RsmB/RsmF family)/NOL1/NOP2/fmu family ribosome biogenesis protein
MGKSSGKKSKKKQFAPTLKPELNPDFKDLLNKDHPNQADQILIAIKGETTVSVRLNPAKIKVLDAIKGHFLGEIATNSPIIKRTETQETANSGDLQVDEIHNVTSGFQVRVNPVPENNHPDSPISLQPVPWEPNAFYLSERPQFTLDPLLHAGGYYVQEASSMLIGATVRNLMKHFKRPIKILDLCAAPGGKSTHLASVTSSNDFLVCNEVIRSRANILVENLSKWGAPNIAVTNNDPEHFQSLGSWFDIVVVDAPCSGEGLFRKDPNAMNEWSAEAVEHCSLRQNRILDAIWPTLNPGGFLVYSTCTFNRSENDEQVRRILDSCEAQSVRVDVRDFPGIIEDQSDDASYWMYRCFPGFVHGEGLTFSVLQKSPDSDHFYHNDPHVSRNALESVPESDLALSLDPDQEWKFLSNKKSTFAIPSAHYRALNELTNSLNVIHAGIEIGDSQRPAHGLAINQSLQRGFYPEVEIDLHSALQYLRRESISLDPDLEGVQLITHKGLPLGFGKAVRGRLNNHYPMEWRIRMR